MTTTGLCTPFYPLTSDVGGPDLMAWQLRHLLATGFGNPRLTLGIIPRRAKFVYTTTCFVLLDRASPRGARLGDCGAVDGRGRLRAAASA
ncbi:DUF5753 domain-containing protein [Nocardia nova]|uniref:Scr1 family TA system antitoxin-like transcriptional regulator n=1 Tax=Nocardia nova TaxID=37330 RepID=UPI001C47AEDD|nr:Scr1 family TA system antitoxin-like transcriptional regulator [Nocardia nova]MBV7707865.1 DUF5753 domain-containing protein [Nocardia nova]